MNIIEINAAGFSLMADEFTGTSTGKLIFGPSGGSANDLRKRRSVMKISSLRCEIARKTGLGS